MKLWVLIETLPDQCEVVNTAVFKSPKDAEKAQARIEKETDSVVEILVVDGITTFQDWDREFQAYLNEAGDEALSTEGED